MRVSAIFRLTGWQSPPSGVLFFRRALLLGVHQSTTEPNRWQRSTEGPCIHLYFTHAGLNTQTHPPTHPHTHTHTHKPPEDNRIFTTAPFGRWSHPRTCTVTDVHNLRSKYLPIAHSARLGFVLFACKALDPMAPDCSGRLITGGGGVQNTRPANGSLTGGSARPLAFPQLLPPLPWNSIVSGAPLLEEGWAKSFGGGLGSQGHGRCSCTSWPFSEACSAVVVITSGVEWREGVPGVCFPWSRHSVLRRRNVPQVFGGGGAKAVPPIRHPKRHPAKNVTTQMTQCPV